MKRRIYPVIALVIVLGAGVSFGGEDLVLKASKDTFVRSGGNAASPIRGHMSNNGASPILYVASGPDFRTLVAFDLGSVTNRILGATFRFQQQDSVSGPIALTIAPMAQTKHNAGWGEGSGSMGAIGENASPGESCYVRSAYPDIQWEGPSGKPVESINDSKLWGPLLVSNKRLDWKKGKWVEIKVDNVALLEKIRISQTPILTLGLWGTSGNGYYPISSKESGKAPELILELEKEKDAPK